jgi:integrase
MAVNSLVDIPIRRRSDGRGWTFRYRAQDGTRPRVTKPTLLEALVAWLELELNYVIEPIDELEIRHGSGAPTLRAFFDNVYRVKHLPQLSEECAVQYQRYFDEHVDPVLGPEPIDAIGTKRVSDLIAALRVKPRTRKGKPTGGTLGTETIRRTLTMLQGVFTLAIQEELIHANPVSLVKKPDKPVPKAVKPLTVEQVERLRLYFLEADDLWSMQYVVVVAYGGLRPSEPLALRRDDVREHTLLVHRTASRGVARPLKNRLPFRTVGLPTFLKEDIDFAATTLRVGRDGLLLPNEQGRMLDGEERRSWHRYTLKPALKNLGLPITRTYDLRHTCASLMLAAHRSVHEVAAQLGHGADMTLKVYGHLVEEYRGRPAIDMEALVRAVRNPN